MQPDESEVSKSCLPTYARHGINSLVAEWIHFTLFGILLPTTHYKTESLHFWGLMNSATKILYPQLESFLWNSES